MCLMTTPIIILHLPVGIIGWLFSGRLLKKIDWDDKNRSINGISETIPGATYLLFFYVPPGFSINQVDVEAEDPTYNLDKNRLLTVSFRGQENPVKWSLLFIKNNHG